MISALIGYVRRHHVGLLALFVALGGTAYAATLPRNSVGPAQLKRNAVTAPKLARGSVTAAKVRDGSLSAAEFAPGTLLAGPAGDRGPQGLPGSDAQFAGAAAGGDLAGTYPSPVLGGGGGTPAALGPGAAVLGVSGAGPPRQPLPNGDETPVTLDVTGFETVEMHSPAEPQSLIAPRPGLYEVVGQVGFSGNSTGRRSLGIGTASSCCFGLQSVQAVADASGFTVVQARALVALNTGERVQLIASHTAGTQLVVQSATASMRWVGPLP